MLAQYSVLYAFSGNGSWLKMISCKTFLTSEKKTAKKMSEVACVGFVFFVSLKSLGLLSVLIRRPRVHLG